MVVRPLKIVQLAIAQFPGPSTRGKSQNDFEQLPSLCFNRDIEFFELLLYLCASCMFNVRDKRLTDVESQNRAISITEICSVFFNYRMDALRSRSNATQTLLWRDIWYDEDLSPNLFLWHLTTQILQPSPFQLVKIFKLFSGFTGIFKAFIWFSEELWKSIAEKTKPRQCSASYFR